MTTMKDDSRPLRFLTFSLGDMMVLGAGGKEPKRKNKLLLTLWDLILGTLNPECLEFLVDMSLRVNYGLSSIYSF